MSCGVGMGIKIWNPFKILARKKQYLAMTCCGKIPRNFAIKSSILKKNSDIFLSLIDGAESAEKILFEFSLVPLHSPSLPSWHAEISWSKDSTFESRSTCKGPFELSKLVP